MLNPALIFLLSILAFNNSAAGTKSENQRLKSIFDSYFEEYLKLYPTFASMTGDYRYNDRLENSISAQHRMLQKELDEKYLRMINDINRDELNYQDKISFDIFTDNLNSDLESLTYNFHLLPFNQLDGMPLLFANMGSGQDIHPFNTPKDYRDFLKRADDFSVWVDTAVSNMREGIKLKVVFPRIIIEKMITVTGNVISEDPAQSIFYHPVEKFPEGFSGQDQQELRRLYVQAISEKINPAYRKLNTFLKDEYLPAGRATTAWTDLPGGTEAYNFLVRYLTTTKLSPDELFTTGIREVERIRREMDSVRVKAGFTGTLKDFFEFLREEPRFYYKNPADLINGYNEIRKTVEANIGRLFKHIPRSGFEIRPVPEFQEKSAAGAFYIPPAKDGSRPGVFYANTHDMNSRPKYDMQCIFLHEAIPGHHFQISIAQEQDNLPKFRNFAFFGAYVEGWALYAEDLGGQLGLYTDIYDYFGKLSSEMLRAIRLVVDTGIHTKNWTKDQAVQYMLDNSAFGRTDIIAEVERYISNPAQALTYKTGELKIKELIQRGREKLGANFDLSAFHNELLKDGALPLDVLENKINDYISGMKKGITKQ